MCGIIGYIGKEQAVPYIIEGLRAQSYRGYDSAGAAVFDGKKINVIKTVGKLGNLEKEIKKIPLPGIFGIGHTRWATHGNVSNENAHPHSDCSGNIFLVHNGIVENFQLLKEKLISQGHHFSSQTDTEVICHLIEHFFKDNLEKAVGKALSLIKGAYGIAVIAKNDPYKIVAARFAAPLVMAANRKGGFVASDPSAIPYSNEVAFLNDGEMAVVSENDFVITDFRNQFKEKTITQISQIKNASQKGQHPHFMLKEIMEQPESLNNTLSNRLTGKTINLKELESLKGKLPQIDRVQIIACGSAYYAGKFGAYFIENFAKIQADAKIASEFRYQNPIFNEKILSIFISQSGETADTLAALKLVKEKGGLNISITNAVGSTLSRQSDFNIYTHSGREIAVATTKVFTSQLTVLILLAIFLNQKRNSSIETTPIIKELQKIPELLKGLLKNQSSIELIAKKYRDFNNFWVMGRKYNYPIALEGALKLKEICYVNANGMAAGELKHGSIALIDKNMPTIAICPSDSVYEKMISNIQEIKARGGPIISIATESNRDIQKIADDVIYIPSVNEALNPLLAVIPLQLLTYFIARENKLPIDQPRNLAKSVTVE